VKHDVRNGSSNLAIEVTYFFGIRPILIEAENADIENTLAPLSRLQFNFELSGFGISILRAVTH
jgi:hypothetical protein